MSGVNTLTLFADDIADVMASFDTIRVQRSLAKTGPWLELTAATAQPASIVGTAVSPFPVSGNALQLKINDADQVDITFSGVNPLTVAQVVSQINAQIAGLSSDDAGHLKLQSSLLGTQSKIHVVGGSAAVLLGFTVDQRVIGKEPYVTLVSGQSNYSFYDRDGNGTGEQEFYYRVAYYKTTTGLTSTWSEPFLAEPGIVIDASKMSLGHVDLVTIEGVSKEGQDITFFPLFTILTVDDYQVGLVKEPITVTTNNAGHAEVSLVRGTKVKVVFVGTSLVREVTIPDAATFDLLALMGSAPDPFNPYYPDYFRSFRRSL